MKYSIILPCFNSSNTILNTLEKTIEQFEYKAQYIIIDDGSTDNSKSIIQTFLKENNQYDIVFIENKKNRGVSYSRNQGLKYVRNEYVLFLDSDDNFSGDLLPIIESKLEEDKFEVIRFNHNLSKFDFGSPILLETLTQMDLEVLSSYYLHSSCTQVFKADIIDNISFNEDLIFGEDLVFSLEILNKSKKTLLLTDVLYLYNQADTSASNLLETNHILNRINSILKAYKIILEKNDKVFSSTLESKKMKELSLQSLKLALIDKKAFKNNINKIKNEYSGDYVLFDKSIFSIHAKLMSLKQYQLANAITNVYCFLKS